MDKSVRTVDDIASDVFSSIIDGGISGAVKGFIIGTAISVVGKGGNEWYTSPYFSIPAGILAGAIIGAGSSGLKTLKNNSVRENNEISELRNLGYLPSSDYSDSQKE